MFKHFFKSNKSKKIIDMLAQFVLKSINILSIIIIALIFMYVLGLSEITIVLFIILALVTLFLLNHLRFTI
jgi:hypothetical protein